MITVHDSQRATSTYSGLADSCLFKISTAAREYWFDRPMQYLDCSHLNSFFLSQKTNTFPEFATVILFPPN